MFVGCLPSVVGRLPHPLARSQAALSAGTTSIQINYGLLPPRPARLALLKSPPSPPSLPPSASSGFFYFFIFHFRFLQKYIFIFKIYRNISRPPHCGVAGAFLQKFSRKIYAEAPGGPVARQRGGRPPSPPGSGATASPGPI